jgi:hypothetical protein
MYLPQACALVGIFVVSCVCQLSGLPPGNAPISICSWSQFRAAMIRDQIYLDGGNIFYQEPNFDPWIVPQTTVYLNLTVGFSLGDNLTELFTPLFNGTSLGAIFYSGFMFANELQFYVYGGLPSTLNGAAPPDDYVFGYNLYSADNGDDTSQAVGPTGNTTTLPEGITRCITDGAGVSIPSEDLGFYFSGMTNPNKFAYDDGQAQAPSTLLMKVNMSTSITAWSGEILPEPVTPRADAQLVWIPVSTSGLLVALGGVVNPESLFGEILNASQVTESESISPSFMTDISIYDIASETWHTQSISGSDHPGQLTGFCAVLAAQNGGSTQSSTPAFNIYAYGGYNGIIGPGVDLLLAQPKNDVWVLSVPSFTWTKVYDGNLTQGRYFHSCFAPYPDQMLVIGGVGFESNCVDSIIKIFNLNTLEWQTGYDPAVWSEYRTPQIVASTIAAAGSIASDMDPKLARLFNTPYEKPITVFYPYGRSASTTEKLARVIKQALASWLGGLLAIVLYLFLSTICLFAIVIIRRRMLLQRSGAAHFVTPGAKGSRFVRWINNVKVDTEEKEGLIDDDEGTPSKLTKAPTKHRKNLVLKLFSGIQKLDTKPERILPGRKEKSPVSGEIYELRTRQLDGVGYNHVSTDQAEEDGGNL